MLSKTLLYIYPFGLLQLKMFFENKWTRYFSNYLQSWITFFCRACFLLKAPQKKTMKNKKNRLIKKFPLQAFTKTRKQFSMKSKLSAHTVLVHLNTQTHGHIHKHFSEEVQGKAQLFQMSKHTLKLKHIQLDVYEIIFEKTDMLVLKCKMTTTFPSKVKINIITVKLKSFAADAYQEYLHYKEMDSCHLGHCFPRIYFFATFASTSDPSTCWGCIAMENFHMSLVDIFFSEKHLSKKHLYNILLKNFELDSYPQQFFHGNSNGVLISTSPKSAKKDLLTSLLITCLQLLRNIHHAHWIHGDSHLGNFMVNVCTMRVVMIDPERSFQSSNAVHKMSDMQEVFAHAVRLSVETPYNGKWNMKDFTGVATLLHPLFSTYFCKDNLPQSCVSHEAMAHLHLKQKLLENFLGKYVHVNPKVFFVFFLLPVCNCFVRDDNEDRNKGCIFCKSRVFSVPCQLCQSELLWNTILETIFAISFIDLRQTILDARILHRAIHDTGIHVIHKNKTLIWEGVRQCLLRDEISFTVVDSDPPLDWASASFQRIYFYPMFADKESTFSSEVIQGIAAQSHQTLEAAFLSTHIQQRLLVDSNVSLFSDWKTHLLDHPSMDSFLSLLPPVVHDAC